MENNLNLNSDGSNEEINLTSLFKKIKRNTLLIISITSISTISSIFYVNKQTPIYSGKFQIVVRNPEKPNVSSPSISSLRLKVNNEAKETQALILKSPLVLNPVFEFAKSQYIIRDQNIKKLSYEKWVKKYLKLEFIDNSDVFEISFQDQDKAFILDTLNLISEKYKIYSKREYNKNIQKELTYLKNQQEIYTKKYADSFKKYNEFAIENNILANRSTISLKANRSVDLNEVNDSENDARFLDQFQLLDEFELQNATYSTKLKPNSKYLKDLNFKINRLKQAIKKPNEIILKNKELEKKLRRDETLLTRIENKYATTKLESAKQKDPWELISIPTLNDTKVSPIKREVVGNFFFLSLFASIIISLIKEIKIGSLDDLDIIKSKLKANFCDSLYLKNIDFSLLIFQKKLKNIKTKYKNFDALNKIGVYSFSNAEIVSDFIEDNPELERIKLEDRKKIENYNDIVLFFEEGMITNKKINYINQFATIYEKINFYWFYISKENNI